MTKPEYVKEVGNVTDIKPPKKVNVNLNDGNWEAATYLAYKLTEDTAHAITGVDVFASSSSNFTIQNGFTRIPKDLNKGAGRMLYTWYTLEKLGDHLHVTGLSVISRNI